MDLIPLLRRDIEPIETWSLLKHIPMELILHTENEVGTASSALPSILTHLPQLIRNTKLIISLMIPVMLAEQATVSTSRGRFLWMFFCLIAEICTELAGLENENTTVEEGDYTDDPEFQAFLRLGDIRMED
jgi:hypothetical protein